MTGVSIYVVIAAIALAYVVSSIQAGRWGRAGVVVWFLGSQALLYWQPSGAIGVLARMALIALAAGLAVYAVRLVRERGGERTQPE